MNLRRRAPVLVGVLTALCLSAGACTPTEPSPPSPSPTPTATPTETQLERQTRLDFEAAEKAYRTFSAEYNRLAHAGGAKEPSTVMKATAAGPYLSSAAKVLRQQYEAKARSVGTLTIVYVRPSGHEAKRLTLDTCEDGSEIRIYDKSGRLLGRGSRGTLTVQARQIDGVWKVWDTSNNETVKSCAE